MLSQPKQSQGLAKRPAIFLDRDGTLNQQVIRDGKPYPPQTVDDFNLFPGVPESCAWLNSAGFILVVATNQPDVGRGTQSQVAVEAMHQRLCEWVPSIGRIEVAYDAGLYSSIPAPRRKPEPGMIHDASAALNLDLSQSWMIGDRWRDIECGKRAGLKTVFIDFGYAEQLNEAPDFIVKSFVEAADVILGRSKSI